MLLSYFELGMAAPEAGNQHSLTRYCPAIKNIYKSASNHWGTKDGTFRNFQTSLANKLDKFIGAQWQGANLGYVTCVYTPDNPNLFYVTLLYNELTLQPSTTNTSWTLDKKGGWFNCNAEKASDCPFTIRPEQKKGNIYQEAEHLKEEANPYDNPGF
jgi:hypothetical protein